MGCQARTVRSVKKRLAALHAYIEDGGPVPDELLDGRIAERFGWTFVELDEQEYPRVIRAVGMMNLVDSYELVIRLMDSHRMEAIPKSAWQAYKMIQDAAKQED